MECTQTAWLSNKDYLQQFHRKVIQQRIPLSGSLDLTHRCNLRCVHCYLGQEKNVREELRTDQWRSIIDQITEAGCLNLLLTGGEPLLRRDFPEIYTHARTNGMLVTIFTNGTLITAPILDLFDELPPYTVEITLYGATAGTYEKITGVKRSYAQCLRGIQRLIERQISLRLKTILMTYNRHEFDEIEKMAKMYDVKFRFDAALFPRFNGDKTPVKLRVSPEEAIEKEFADEERLRKWQEFVERFRNVPGTDDLYQCGAGVSAFHVDPYGRLQPCLMVRSITYDLCRGKFLTGWDEVISRIREKKIDAAAACTQCAEKLLCGYCPGFFALENGNEEAYSQYLCDMGQQRAHRISEGFSTGE